ncbi:colicin release lysis protein [Salmonella enterica]|nr:colicin release lysis protein [Salmonella enterica]
MSDSYFTNVRFRTVGPQTPIRDVQGGTVAPSSSSELTGIAVQ